MVFTLPIVLGLYEVLYRRSGLRGVLVRLLPFVVIALIVSPLWLYYKPHPLYYNYIDFPPRAGWYSFFSVVGATGWYLKGLLLGWGIPVVLHEAVERILSFPHWRFLLWGLIDLGILTAVVWASLRKRWAGLGILFLFATMIPFLSTAWNGVDEYLSWTHLYVPLVGLALLFGGLADRVWFSPRRGLRTGLIGFLCLLVLYFGVQQARINVASRSAIGHWGRVLRLNPTSEIASVELGKAYLRQGEPSEALRFLFSPVIRNIQPSCLVMSCYYCAQGDYLASAVHLQKSIQTKPGLQYQDYEPTAAELFYAAGAPDYVEDSLKWTLMANPYNVAAIERVVEVLLLKGYVPAAERLIERTLELAPFYSSTQQMQRVLETYQGSLAISNVPQVIHPPSPDWLRYVTQGVSNPRLRQQIVQLSEQFRTDPVIQMEAGICLVRDGQPDRALSKLESVAQVLSSCGHAWAMKCW
ncbi:MAG: hypothetical protein KAT86_06505, partial [Candidatus Latescibacteria bacterium]|nr:hypothetical protein [Candidatus Latescibacterota bacterium]